MTDTTSTSQTTATSDTTPRTKVAGLQVATTLYDFITGSVLPRTGQDPDAFWSGFADIVKTYTPRNKELLARREELQTKLNEWYTQHPGEQNIDDYDAFLHEIGYVVDNDDDFQIDPVNIDPEISETSGPQLVVPVLNARFALNAANARWGSLYDALYGTDAIPEDGGAEKDNGGYNKLRGDKVIAWSRDFLDKAVPLVDASHHDVTRYDISDGSFVGYVNDEKHELREPEVYAGYAGDQSNPTSVLLRHNGLYIDILIDPESPIGSTDKAGVKDIILDAAVSTLIDFEDSVAAVDATDKTLGYSNWFQLNTGELEEEVTKGDKTFTRRLNPDREYTSPDGESFTVHGRTLMFTRNVGHLMTNPAILLEDGSEVFEGIMDTVMTAVCGIPGIDKNNPMYNSSNGSIYIVKPKQHGPEEVEFTNDLLGATEKLLGLPENTIKVGVMDEERRTTLNLDACIKAVSKRLAFINTGFLDRTGDEIHTSMEAGPMIRKGEMKSAPWMQGYEDNNVDAGIAHGLPGKAQIGKGMWAKTELMADMLAEKISQPEQGATTAWVPSPTAATLHATHYHQVDVFTVDEKLRAAGRRDNYRDRLTLPVSPDGKWSDEDIKEEVDNNCQSILGYVIRWVEQGVGCSKIPDIHDIDLMEDRATLRISSQLLANWLRHGIITEDYVIEALKRMAKVVDKQNEGDPAYRPMSADYDKSIGWQAAKDLILDGTTSPSGYTEPILHRRRREFKEREGIA